MLTLRRKKPLILDSSLLIAMAEKRNLSLDRVFEDVLCDFKLATTASVVEELREMASGKGSRALKARVALTIAGKLKIFDSISKDADTDVIEVAAKLGGVVATCDLELRRKAMRKRVPTLYLRGGKRLMIDNTLGSYLP